MIRTLILGHWYTQQDGDKTLMAIRCQKCRNLMRAEPGKTVICGRDGATYTAPASFRGITPLITRKDLSNNRQQRLQSKSFRDWQDTQDFDLTERKWRERMRDMEKEDAQQCAS
jgi:hypothetical protein